MFKNITYTNIELIESLVLNSKLKKRRFLTSFCSITNIKYFIKQKRNAIING